LIKHAENYNGDLAQALWQQAFKDIFDTFEGQHVNVYDDDEVLQKLKAHYHKVNESGTISYAKAQRLFRFFRSIKNEGFEGVKETTAHNTFYRNVKELTAVVPRAYLANLHSVKDNIVPLVRLINVDFSQQHPAGYVTPLHMSQQITGSAQPLRLVS
jgi:II/X family phage/plasmid replication protein